jgi:DNA-binding GntR family transcriptional regulator
MYTAAVMPLSREVPRTVEALAADELRAAIVRGDLPPGAKIRQEATAAELGVSLIPMREALRTLAGEGIVTYQPQRGYFVSELPAKAIPQLYAARTLIEAEVERLAVPRLREADIAILGTAIRAQERAVEERDAVAMIAANHSLHFAIFERCENPWLVRFTRQLWDSVDPYRVLSYRAMWTSGDQDELPLEILAEHRRILRAVERGEAERALELLRRHRGRSETFLAALTPALDGRAVEDAA